MTPKKTDPLTLEETKEAATMFIERFNIVNELMPKGSTTEDSLKVMETVAKLGHKLRADKAEEERLERFGFVKQAELDALESNLKEELKELDSNTTATICSLLPRWRNR